MFVKKIWSFNPSKYKFVALDTALEYYSRYVAMCIDTKHTSWKSFDQWLRTEISNEVHGNDKASKQEILKALEARFCMAEISTYKANDPDGTCFTDDGNIHYTFRGVRYCLDFGQNHSNKWFDQREVVITNWFKKIK